jgi:hypothetical protein
MIEIYDKEVHTQITTTGKFMAGGCIHGSLVSDRAFGAFLDVKKAYKPKHMICLGDVFELTALRRGATNLELRISNMQDIEDGLECLGKMMKGIRGERWLLCGNHDLVRIESMLQTGSAMNKELAEVYIAKISNFCKKHRIKVKPYCSNRGVIEINGNLFFHGIHFGVNAAKDHVSKYHKDCIFVHTHRAEQVVCTGWPKPIVAINCGMLRQPFPSYAERTTSVLSWSHACAKGEFLADGTHTKELVLL